eukprot:c12133_g1_i2.p1 GENE.c12133_g1_i2~~c12133_g1_i2.p1  ORF type:complete len:432 (-),score=73.43 c12133_g1_i2:115-1410(-)
MGSCVSLESMTLFATAGIMYSLVLLNNTIGHQHNAVCLDGSPGAFYFYPAASVDAKTKFQIHFEGGGWCYNEKDCSNRATGTLGSSRSYPFQMPAQSGLLSSDCNMNPEFCNFNKVYLKYCDGNSFASNRDAPFVVPNGKVSPIHFRGFAILQAVILTLASDYGLDAATHIHLSGCSAGGLATFLHTNFVGDLLQTVSPKLEVFKSTPVSGFFLLHNNVLDVPVYPSQMQQIFELSNATSGLDQDCIKAFEATPDELWKCNFAPYSYEHIRYPIFPLNSAYDSWQSACIFASSLLNPAVGDNDNCSSVPSWSQCADDPITCLPGQIYGIIEFETDFVSEMVSRSAVFGRAGNGAFVHSCHEHCEAMYEHYATIKINGVSMAQAVSNWWISNNEPAANHTYYPCILNTDGTNCNPTCVGDRQEPLVPRERHA